MRNLSDIKMEELHCFMNRYCTLKDDLLLCAYQTGGEVEKIAIFSILKERGRSETLTNLSYRHIDSKLLHRISSIRYQIKRSR